MGANSPQRTLIPWALLLPSQKANIAPVALLLPALKVIGNYEQARFDSLRNQPLRGRLHRLLIGKLQLPVDAYMQNGPIGFDNFTCHR